MGKMACFWSTVLLTALVYYPETARAQSRGDLRLVDSFGFTGGSGGRLEIFINSEWGTICDDWFGSSEAFVACQQLGFSSATAYGNNLGFGSGSSSQPIWLDQVDCDTFDSRIIDCSHNAIGSHNCGHHEDVMIQCIGSSFPTVDPTPTTDFDAISGELRLVQGSSTSSSFTAGRLEIFINGEWGTVCDDGFSFVDARIACQQLGYTTGLQYGNNLGFGSGSSFQPIWLDDISCSAFDARIIDCSHSGIGAHNCGHNEDVQINCGTAFVPTFSPDLIDGDLRLVQGSDTSSSFSQGRLEIVFDGKWGTICDDFFGLDEANVACRQLGYSSATQHGRNLGFGSGSNSQEIWLDNVFCTSFDSRIVDCSHNTIGDNNCQHFQDIMISCINPVTDPTDSDAGSGALRLVQGSRTSSSFTAGRLEIFLNGEWGTICDDGFFSTEADVACQQLGYTEALQYGNNLGFGSGSSVQEIWLDNVGCTTFDTRIIDCFHNGIGNHDCTHSEDVMVNCGSTVFPTIAPGTSFPESSSNIVGVIVGSIIGVTVLIIIVVVAFVIGCVCCGVCAASSATSSRRTAPPTIVTGYSANTATVTTVTSSQQQRANTAAAFATSAQQPPPATNYYASQPVQGYGIDLNTRNQQAHFTSQQAPPPYNAAMQYPAVQQQHQQSYPPPPAYPTMEQQRQPNPTEELQDPLPSAPYPYPPQQQQQQQPYYPQEQAYPPDQQQYPPSPNQAPYPTDQLQAAAPCIPSGW